MNSTIAWQAEATTRMLAARKALSGLLRKNSATEITAVRVAEIGRLVESAAALIARAEEHDTLPRYAHPLTLEGLEQ